MFSAEELKSSLSKLSRLVLTGEGLSIALTPAGTPALVPGTRINLGKVATGTVSFTAVIPGWDEGLSVGYTWNGVYMGQIGPGVSSAAFTVRRRGRGEHA